jgi:hypothetical protein
MVSVERVFENVKVLVIGSHFVIGCAASPPLIHHFCDEVVAIVQSKANRGRLLPTGSTLYLHGNFGHDLP